MSFYLFCFLSTALRTIEDKMKEFIEAYQMSGDQAAAVTPASYLNAEKLYWESHHPFSSESPQQAPPPAVSRILPLILPIHGRSWLDEHVKIPMKALKSIKAHLAKTKGLVTHVKQSTISGYGLFASKIFTRYACLHAYHLIMH